MSAFIDGFYRGVGAMVGVLVVTGLLLGALWLYDRLNPDFFTLD